MDPQDALRRLRATPQNGAKDRVRAKILQSIAVPAMLAEAKRQAEPTPALAAQVWQRVSGRIASPHAAPLLERLRGILQPSPLQQESVRLSLFERLHRPEPVRHVLLKWTAAFAVVALVVRVSPLVFLTQRSVAQSSATAIPTVGQPELSTDGTWNALAADTLLDGPAMLRTAQAEATVLLNDDGNVRIDRDTTLSIRDVSDRPQPGPGEPTIVLQSGRIWVQGFVPSHVRPITIVTPDGVIAVHEGSVSVEARGGVTTVRVWDRHADVNPGLPGGVVLTAGESTEIRADTVFPVQTFPLREEQDAWATQNLRRDAVHRREVALLQSERRAARAGILPSSPLYSVKRVAEEVDVLLSFNSETKVQKRLEQATRRLDEAAGLIAAGESGATLQIQAFHDTLLAVAAGTGRDLATQSLIRNELAANTAELSASRPEDDNYALKVAVLETSASLPATSSEVDAQSVRETLLSDSIDSLQQALDTGDVIRATEMYDELKPHVDELQGEGSLRPEVRKEVLTSLQEAAETLQGTGSTTMAVVAEEGPAVRPPKTAPSAVPLTPEQREQIALEAFRRITRFDQPRPQLNQAVYEARSIATDYPEEAIQILSALHRMLPLKGDALSRTLREEIQGLRTR